MRSWACSIYNEVTLLIAYIMPTAVLRAFGPYPGPANLAIYVVTFCDNHGAIWFWEMRTK